MSANTYSETGRPNPASLHGKKFDVMLVEADGAGREKSVLLTGTGRWNEGRFSIYRGVKSPELTVPTETLAGLVPAPRALRSLLEGADYMIKLHVRHHPPATAETLALL